MKPLTAAAWAAGLSDTELAVQLRKLVAGTYLLGTRERQAVLIEAATRLEARQ